MLLKLGETLFAPLILMNQPLIELFLIHYLFIKFVAMAIIPQQLKKKNKTRIFEIIIVFNFNF